MIAARLDARPRSALRAALWGLNGYLLPLLVTLAAMPLLYRGLGPAHFGVFTLALLAPAIASGLDLGLASASVRRSAALLQVDPADELGTVVASFGGALALVGAVIGLVIYAAAGWISRSLGFEDVIGTQSAHAVLAVCAVWAALTPVLSVPGNLLRAAQQFGAITAIQTAATIATWVGAIWLVIEHRPLLELVALAAGVAIGAGMVGAIVAWPLVTRTHFGLRPAVVLKDVRFSAGLALMQVASLVAYQADRLLIAAILSPAAAGSYALCANLANKLMFSVSSLTSFAFPRAAALAGAGVSNGPAQLLQSLVRNLVPLVSSTIVPALLLADPFFRLWLGESFQSELVRLFQLLWIGFSLVSVAVPASHVIIGTGNSRLSAIFAWVTAATSLLLLAVLLPRMGLAGAGLAAIGAYSTSLVFLQIVRRTLGVAPDRQWNRMLAGCAVAIAAQGALVLLVLPWVAGWISLVSAAAAAIAVFFGARIALGFLTDEESRLLDFFVSRN